MDAIEAHDNTVFNSYHFHRVTSFQRMNAEKEDDWQAGLIQAGRDSATCYLQCSPALNGMINRLYNWQGADKIYKTEVSGTNSIMSEMRSRGFAASERTFVGLDAKGKQSHYSKASPVKLNSSVANWAKNETTMNGVGFFLVSVSGGYHSLFLVVDRRGDDVTFRLLDQHGNNSTGSHSSFDRLTAHDAAGIDGYMLQMLRSWYGVDYDDDSSTSLRYNANIEIMELRRD